MPNPILETYKNKSTGTIYDLADSQARAGKVDNSVIAPVENGTTASQAYAVGTHFIRNGAFCTVTQAIASGETLTENTNYTSGDVADELAFHTVKLSGDSNINVKTVDETISLSERYDNFNKIAFLVGRNNNADGVQIIMFPVEVLTDFMGGTTGGHILIPVYEDNSGTIECHTITLVTTSATVLTVKKSTVTGYGIRAVWGCI